MRSFFASQFPGACLCVVLAFVSITAFPQSPSGVRPLAGAQPCTNADFEDGTITGWNARLWDTNPEAPAGGGDPEPIKPRPSPDAKYHEIMTGGFDPIIGSGLPVVAPGGRYSVRLGDDTHNGKAATISQTFTVEPGNAYFTYRYAVVLEEPTVGQGSQEEEHADWQRPYFRVNLVDGQGQEIPCSRYGVLARPPLAGFQKVEKRDDKFRITRTYHWRGWTTVTIPLDKYVGQNITISFTTSDCNLGAHLGYAYVDASCPRNLSITSSKNAICGNVAATLTAPEGFQDYQWSGPGLTGATNAQQATANQPGTYQVTLTPFASTDACGKAAQITLQHTVGDGSDFTGGPDKTVCFGDKVTLEASGGDTYTWSPATGLSNPNIANPTFTPARNETYTVEYTVTSCSRTDVVKITVKPKIKIEVEDDTIRICPGQTASMKASGADTYEWHAGTGDDGTPGGPVGTGPAIVVKPSATTTYQVTGYKGEGCSDTKSVVVIVEQVRIFENEVVVCESLPGQPLGVRNLFASGAYTYTWSWKDPFTNADRSASGQSLEVSEDDLSPDKSTKYYVTGVNKAGNCTSRDSVSVSRMPSDNIRVATPRIRICKGQLAQLQAFGATNGKYSYTAVSSTGSYSSGDFTNDTQVAPSQTTTYYIKSQLQCTNEEQVVVEVDAVDAGTDINVCKGDPLQLQARYVSGMSVTECQNSRYYGQGLIKWQPETAAPGQAVPVTTLNRTTQRITAELNIGFPFRFYCHSYNTFYITSSGFIAFDRNNGGTNPQRISTSTRNNLIALAWADLDPTQGSISYFTTGTAPNRRLVVTFDKVPVNGSRPDDPNPLLVSTQAILYETTNEIEIHITKISIGTIHSAGIKGGAGTSGLPVEGRNLANRDLTTISASEEAYRFTPPRQALRYSWSPATGLSDPNSANPTVATNVPDEYEYVVTAFNGTCSTNDTVRVTVNDRPELALSANREICYGKKTVLTADVTSAKHVEYFYEWSPAEGLDKTQGPQVIASPGKTTWYKVRAINGFGCIDIDSVLVTVNQLPKIVLNQKDMRVCRNTEVQLAVNLESSEALPASYVWTWQAADGTTQTVNNPSITDKPQRTTTYTVKGTDDKSCENTASITVTIPESSLQVRPMPNDSLCLGESITLTASGAFEHGEGAYTWHSVSNGIASESPVFTGVSLLQRPTLPGTYTFQVTAEDTCHNISTREVRIVVHPLPKVVASPAATAVCAGSAAELSVDPVSTATRYTWMTLDGIVLGTERKLLIKPTANTQYVLSGTDGNGCAYRDTVQVTVNPLPVVTASRDKNICAGEFADLRAQGAATYQWTDGTGLVGTGDSLRVMPARTTTYVATGIDDNGCADTARVTVTVRGLFTTPDTAICAGDLIRLTAGIGYDRYRWSAPGLADLEGDTVQVRPAATTAYTIAGFAPGCNATGTVRVTVVPLPVVDLGPDTLICEGETVTLRAAPGGARYRWTYVTHGDILSTATDSVLRVEAPGVYAVEVFNRLGCSVTDTVRLASCSNIAEKYPLFIPNVITPNNDGFNDTWTVRNLDKYGNNRLVISNRWGHEVYRVNNYHNQWLGDVPTNGMYFYQLWLEKGNRLYKGWIHVWR